MWSTIYGTCKNSTTYYVGVYAGCDERGVLRYAPAPGESAWIEHADRVSFPPYMKRPDTASFAGRSSSQRKFIMRHPGGDFDGASLLPC